MLNKKYRLKKHSAFNATYRLNNIAVNKNICIYFGKEKNDLSIPTKFAFVVSKKISKRAVKRNRIKRLMRESIRLMLKKNENPLLNKYISIIFVAKNLNMASDFEFVNSSLVGLLTSNQ